MDVGPGRGARRDPRRRDAAPAETPRWLAGHGHADQARAALRRLRSDDADIEAEIGQLRADLRSDVQALPQSRLGHAAARLPLIVGIGLAVFQQVTGINT